MSWRCGAPTYPTLEMATQKAKEIEKDNERSHVRVVKLSVLTCEKTVYKSIEKERSRQSIHRRIRIKPGSPDENLSIYD